MSPQKRSRRRRAVPTSASRWVVGASTKGELYLRRRPAERAAAADDPLQDIDYPFAQSFTFVARRWRNLMNDELRAVGQTDARWGTLYWINVFGNRVNQTELAERMGVEQPTLARVLLELESDGLIVRRLDRSDQRAKVVELTATAAPVIRQINRINDSVVERLLAGIDTSELTACLAVFARILANIDRH